MVLMIAAPVLAVEVKVEQVATDSNQVRLKFLTAPADANRPRAFGLNIVADNGKKVSQFVASKFGESTSASKGYGIFPGEIVIDGSGTVTSWGQPIASGDHTTTGVVELGSLYSGAGNEPDTQGNLLTFKVTGDCNISITLNSARGGVIKENGGDAAPTLTGAKIAPPCKTCRGDIDDNNKVNKADIGVLSAYIGAHSAAPFWAITPASGWWRACYDVDNNGTINKADIGVLSAWIGANSAAPFWTTNCQ